MPELIAKSALEGQPPKTHGQVTLAQVEVGQITSIALFPGRDKALAKGLKTLGLAMPTPGTMAGANGARIVWTGRDQAFLLGVDAPALEGAALTDQSGGWATLSLHGATSADVLMRLIPMDLRLQSFAMGRAARVGLNHMSAVLMRVAEDGFEIMVFRSMARTAWHEIEEAMITVAARTSR